MTVCNCAREEIINAFPTSTVLHIGYKISIQGLMMAYDPSQIRCNFCHSSEMFMDYSQGDAVCTSCGVVHAEKLQYDGAEWRDFSAVNDEDKRNVARAGSVVDESRWNGGLEPTSLGPVFGGYSGDAERNRKRLNKVKKAVDFWMNRDFERRVNDSRLAIQIKGKRRNKSTGDEQDWTELGTNEHEQIARQRIDDLQSSEKMLVSEKWSLDRALLLHGSDDEIPDRYTGGAKPRDLEQERDSLLKRMDISQRKASADLYKNYSLLRGAIRRLNLQQNVGIVAEAMDVICKYVNLKGAFTVKGVSTKISTSPASVSPAKSKRIIEDHRKYNKARQMASLGAAFIYLICKKNGLGRTLAEICASLHFEDVDSSTSRKQSALQSQTFIKAKHCSKAMAEIRSLMPEYVQSVTMATGKPTVIQSSSNTIAVKSESNSLALSTSIAPHAASVCASGSSNYATTSATNLVEHTMRKLQLSAASIASITNLVIYAKENIEDGNKPAVLVAAIAYLVCDAGAIMQKLAKQATIMKDETKINIVESNNKSERKRKHIRPAGHRHPSSKKRRVGQSKAFIPLKVTSTDIDSQPSSVTPEPEPFDALSHSVEEKKSSSPFPSWSEWNRQKSWGRSFEQIRACCSVSFAAMKDCYSKQIYPIRKELLIVLQKSFIQNTNLDGCEVDIMIGNIAAAAPLMSANLK